MAIFKCKMCGGTLDIKEGASVAECEYCGIKQTIPRLDDDRRINLYDRANHFRRNNDYDKAMSIYEQILNDDKTDAEAYWSLVLCRYGIEYVEDPLSHKRVPTVNRTQYTSVFADEDYKSAVKFADSAQRVIYEKEAKAIDEIQKGILEISQKEEPFDVFICYKETDSSGRRTLDSVLANDLYHELTEEGFKVFYSRITLEDKLGYEYEPYIFAALHSAKIMVVLGTKPEHFTAVWVKNEWSRYLSLIRNGEKKMLIPAYKDMDPYDLPDEFSHLQAQDMSKLGFMQDIIRGIKKIAGEPAAVEESKPQSKKPQYTANAAPLLERAFLFLEDCDWESADEYCEKVLDLEPKNAQAYVGKLMAELECSCFEALSEQDEPFDDLNNFKKAVRFGDEALIARLQDVIDTINSRNDFNRCQMIYESALSYMNEAVREDDYRIAAEKFESIPDFEDSAQLAVQCREKAETTRQEKAYDEAVKYSVSELPFQLKNAISLFESIPGWRDADERLEQTKKKYEEVFAKDEARRAEDAKKQEAKKQAAKKRNKIIKRISLIIILVGIVIIAIAILYKTVIYPAAKYDEAVGLMEVGSKDEAAAIFAELGNYKDSPEMLKKAKYESGVYCIKMGELKKGYNLLSEAKDYKDTQTLMADKIGYMLRTSKVGDIIPYGLYEQDNNKDNGKESIEWQVLKKESEKALVISKYCIESKAYNDESFEDTTWADCSLRRWLNFNFADSAFTEEQKEKIEPSYFSTPDNEEYGTSGGTNSNCRLFLLSKDEATEYFPDDNSRIAEPVSAIKLKINIYDKQRGTCDWWLRSPGCSEDYALCVYADGTIDDFGSVASRDGVGIRPAMWIKLD